MTLAASGAISTGDINTELGRALDAPFSTSDADFIALCNATSGDPLEIPTDVYSRLMESYTVTVGEHFGRYGFLQFNAGSVTPSTYQGSDIEHLLTENGAGFEFTTQITIGSTPPADYITHVHFVNEDMVLEKFSQSYFHPTVFTTYTSAGGLEPWDAGDLAASKTVKLYGTG